MCGFAGWVDFHRDLSREGETLEAMAGTLEPRGPDAGGLRLGCHAALGHRRLIVLDPEGGGQPMTRTGGRGPCTIVYNGEIYNMPELRRELSSRGRVLETRNSDTEALLLTYLEWGPGCLERLNGIFAFAIWDEDEQRLFMARDRLGVKPAFYMEHRGGLLFASEPKALLAHPEVEAAVDGEGLAEIFLLGPSRTPGHGVFLGMKEIKPGYCFLFDRRGLRGRRYWALESQPHRETADETAARVRCLLQEATERQLLSDKPVGTLLSGGLDSSALTAFAANYKGRGMLKTFSVEYRGNDTHFAASSYQPEADAPWVRLISRQLGTRHRQVLVDTAELVSALEPAVRARDLPGMADVDASLYLFCREIKKEVTVALSGEGADEIFGGYPWFLQEESLGKRAFPWVRFPEERLSLLREEVREALPRDYAAQRYEETLAEVPRLPGESLLEQRRRELFYLNITWFMTALLERKDRMSMASGLEVRVPFCDHQLVEYVWNIPWEIKYFDNTSKGILRRALAGLLPRETLKRRKSPYPKTHNPLYLKAVKSRLGSVLKDTLSPLARLVDPGKLGDLLASGRDIFPEPWFGQLMGEAQYYAYLLQVNYWLVENRVSVLP